MMPRALRNSSQPQVGGGSALRVAGRKAADAAVGSRRAAHVADPATGAATPLSDAQIFAAARALMPQAAMVQQRLERARRLLVFCTLPATRHAGAAPGSTMRRRPGFTSTPIREISNRSDASRRSYRWLFNALHSFDFPLLLSIAPHGMRSWLLSLLGLTISVSGIVIGWRRLCRMMSWSQGGQGASAVPAANGRWRYARLRPFGDVAALRHQAPLFHHRASRMRGAIAESSCSRKRPAMLQ